MLLRSGNIYFNMSLTTPTDTTTTTTPPTTTTTTTTTATTTSSVQGNIMSAMHAPTIKLLHQDSNIKKN